MESPRSKSSRPRPLSEGGEVIGDLLNFDSGLASRVFTPSENNNSTVPVSGAVILHSVPKYPVMQSNYTPTVSGPSSVTRLVGTSVADRSCGRAPVPLWPAAAASAFGNGVGGTD